MGEKEFDQAVELAFILDQAGSKKIEKFVNENRNRLTNLVDKKEENICLLYKHKLVYLL